MELNYKQFGDHGNPLIILHGLFGSLDNWQTLAKSFSQHFKVYIVDQRNHGKSPHSTIFDYPTLANDLTNFIQQNQLTNSYIIGHSMGGKVAMQFALEHPEKLSKLIVVDIAPKAYSSHHDLILETLNNFPIEKITSRKEAEDIMAQNIEDFSVRQFLLKNLDRITDGKYQWRMNLPTITQCYDNILSAIKSNNIFNKHTLFIKGGKSAYIKEEDIFEIKRLFPDSTIKTISNAGHWVHAEEPEAFYKTALDFLLQ